LRRFQELRAIIWNMPLLEHRRRQQKPPPGGRKQPQGKWFGVAGQPDKHVYFIAPTLPIFER